MPFPKWFFRQLKQTLRTTFPGESQSYLLSKLPEMGGPRSGGRSPVCEATQYDAAKGVEGTPPTEGAVPGGGRAKPAMSEGTHAVGAGGTNKSLLQQIIESLITRFGIT